MKCSKCDKDFSINDWSCPHCGQVSPMFFVSIGIVLVGLFIILIVKFANTTSSERPQSAAPAVPGSYSPSSPSVSRDEALRRCRSEVEKTIGLRLEWGYSDEDAFKAGQVKLRGCMREYSYSP